MTNQIKLDLRHSAQVLEKDGSDLTWRDADMRVTYEKLSRTAERVRRVLDQDSDEQPSIG